MTLPIIICLPYESTTTFDNHHCATDRYRLFVPPPLVLTICIILWIFFKSNRPARGRVTYIARNCPKERLLQKEPDGKSTKEFLRISNIYIFHLFCVLDIIHNLWKCNEFGDLNGTQTRKASAAVVLVTAETNSYNRRPS